MKARGKCARCLHNRVLDLPTLTLVEHNQPKEGAPRCSGSGSTPLTLRIIDLVVEDPDSTSALEALALSLWQHQQAS